MTRRRWAYTMGGEPLPEPVEVTEDYVGGDGRMPLFTDRWREGTAATDGTDIGSRAKEREYMQRHGLAHAGDYTQHWQKAEQQRAEYRSGKAPAPRELKEQVGRIAYELRGKRR